MSFILDALRKSETERQRQSGPRLADAGYRPPAKRRGWWLPVLVIVLGANLLLLGALWLRREPSVPPTPANPAATVAPVAAQPVPAATPAQASGASADAEFAAVADMPAIEPTPAPVVSPSPPAPQTGDDAQAGQPAGGGKIVKDNLPTVRQLVAEGALSVPDMHLDIHVFSEIPAERFVFINMRRYTEGAQLKEGPRVAQITRDGVILDQNGQRFILTRD